MRAITRPRTHLMCFDKWTAVCFPFLCNAACVNNQLCASEKRRKITKNVLALPCVSRCPCFRACTARLAGGFLLRGTGLGRRGAVGLGRHLRKQSSCSVQAAQPWVQTPG